MSEVNNIYTKLAKIRKSVEVIQKNKSGYGYKYVSDDEILAKITGLMDKLNVSLIPSIVPGTTKVDQYTYIKTKINPKTAEKYDEVNNEVLVSADSTYTWVDNEDPSQCITIPWSLVGQQSDASQSFGSGLTYSFRYFLLKFFGIATPEDDPDNWRSKQKEAEEAENKSIAEQIIKEFDEKLRMFLADHQDKKEEVAAFISKYAKKGNYFSISIPSLASKLLEDFEKTFLG